MKYKHIYIILFQFRMKLRYILFRYNLIPSHVGLINVSLEFDLNPFENNDLLYHF